MPADPAVEDAELKASQAANFNDLNDVIAATPFDKHARFFNFGYRTLGDEQPVGPTLGRGFPNQDSAQLLFQLVGDTDLTGTTVVEVGCGRGGNLWLLRKYFGTRQVIGVDIAEKSIEFCRRDQPHPDARFEVGDAESVPLPDGIADVVLNVETSCTYPDIERFFREVARLLPVGGRFLYTDLILRELHDPYLHLLAQLGLELDHERDISANVTASRVARAARQQLAYGSRPEADAEAMSEYVGVEGSMLHDVLTDGSRPYTLFRFTKTSAPEPPAERVFTAEEQQLVRDGAALAVRLLTIPSAAE